MARGSLRPNPKRALPQGQGGHHAPSQGLSCLPHQKHLPDPPWDFSEHAEMSGLGTSGPGLWCPRASGRKTSEAASAGPCLPGVGAEELFLAWWTLPGWGSKCPHLSFLPLTTLVPVSCSGKHRCPRGCEAWSAELSSLPPWPARHCVHPSRLCPFLPGALCLCPLTPLPASPTPGTWRGPESSGSEGGALRRGPYRRAKVRLHAPRHGPHLSARHGFLGKGLGSSLGLPQPSGPSLRAAACGSILLRPPRRGWAGRGFGCWSLGLLRPISEANSLLFSPQSEMSENRQGRGSSTGDEEDGLAILRRWVAALLLGTPGLGQ